MKSSLWWKGGLLLFLLSLGGCMEDDDGSDDEEPECTPTPAFCDGSVPSRANLTIDVSSPPPEEVTIYEGSSYETGRIVWSGKPRGSSWSIPLPFGPYSATATYRIGGQTIIAVDGDYLDYTETDTCTGTCYDTEDGEVDLELE